MKKVAVNYNESTSTLTFPDGTIYTVAQGMVFEEVPENDVLSLVKAGLSAEDLINLKKAEIL